VNTLTQGSVVDLQALDSRHSIGTTAKSAVRSAADVSLAKLSLLGGFVTLDGFANKVTAFSDGTAKGTGAHIQPNLAKVHVGSPVGLDLVLGPNGLVANLAGSSLPAEITGLVNTLVDSISDVLSTLGVKISVAEYKTRYSNHHRAVSVAGSGLQVLVNNPLTRNNTNFNKAVVGVQVGAVAASAGAGTIVTPDVPHIANPSKKPPLAYTGAELPLTAGAAMIMLGAAFVIRRKMLAADNG
jgi:hypothetical protein